MTGHSYARSFDAVTYTDGSAVATVGSFLLETYEVTVGRFRKFVASGGGTQNGPQAPGDGAHPKIQASGWDVDWDAALPIDTAALTTAVKCDPVFQTWTDAPGPNEKRPMNCITWYEAFAFCAWDGGRLPTEAEWNYAAAGGGATDGQRVYPWSVPPSSSLIASTDAVFDCSEAGSGCTGLIDLPDVGAKSPNGEGRWGQSDLAGSVAEWVLDVFVEPYGIVPCVDCAELALEPGGSADRVARGGDFDDPASAVVASARRSFAASTRNRWLGARCARDP